MSRSIGATNITHVEGDHVHPITMIKFQFDTPVYVHSGIGTISFGGNDYLGVGDFGSVDSVDESEQISPSPIRLTLSGIDATNITEALDAGNYGDLITIYEGLKDDSGALIADPWTVAGGFFEHASIVLGSSNQITITMQHDLSRLKESNGRKFTDEDQQQEFTGDTGFSFVTDVIDKKLEWAGRVVTATNDANNLDPSERDRRDSGAG